MGSATIDLAPRAGTPAPPAVHAVLHYQQAGTPRPVSYTFEPPAGTPWSTAVDDPRSVPIHDARPLAARGELALDRQGFALLTQVPSALRDFSDEAAIRAVYYPEVAALLRGATGAEKVVVFDHTLRDSEHGSRVRGGLREPVLRVHNDQTFVSGPRRVRDHLPADEAERRLRSRFAVVNLWRPLASVERLPLALCDARSIGDAERVTADLVYRDKVGETFAFTYSPAHRWHWFPRLQPDEALLLKIYDSRTDGTARLTAHTAFEHPDTPPDAPPRRSIELRALLFWAPEP